MVGQSDEDRGSGSSGSPKNTRTGKKIHFFLHGVSRRVEKSLTITGSSKFTDLESVKAQKWRIGRPASMENDK